MVRFSVLAVALLFVAFPVWAGNIYVDANNPEAFATIAGAIEEAEEGDVIFVSEGFYPETITIDENIHLIGEGADLVILSYALEGQVINVGAETDTTTRIEGFTITAKNGWGIAIADGGSATIRNCLITRCSKGAISMSGSESLIRLNQFTDNQMGMYIGTDQGSVITNNVFKGNVGGSRDGWQGWSGTVFFYQGTVPTIFANNLLKGNTADAAIHCWGSSPQIRNNVIVENGQYGIALFSERAGAAAAPLITGNIIAGNGAFGIRNPGTATPIITYNDVYDNASGDYNGVSDDIGGIDKDPKFENPGKDDYYLQDGSPCYDAGTSGAAYLDPDGSRNDMGMYGGPFARLWEQPYTGPVVTDISVTPATVQQGGTITIQATGTTVKE